MADLGLRTVNDVLARTMGRGAATVMQWQDGAGSWQPIRSAELYGKVRALAGVLAGWGLKRGDRLAIISENRWEWMVTDFAALALGVADVPLYPTLAADQLGYMLQDSGAKVVVVSSRELYEKVSQAGELAELEHVVVMDEGQFAGAESFGGLLAGWEGMQGPDAGFDAMLMEAKPEELVTIIYTSGTTGTPKGVMLTHHNLATNINVALPAFGLGGGDSHISYLPLSHIFERHVEYADLAEGILISFCPRFDQLPAAMKVLRPTLFVGVPRVFEKIRQGVEGKSGASPVKKAILNWALGVGKKHRAEILERKTPGSLIWKIANKLVFSKILEAFGGRVRIFISGSAPLGMDTAGWFADAGIVIYEGYGLTETSPVVSMNYPGANRMNTIGRALPNLEVRFAADGELEVKGSCVFTGYWHKEQETKETFTEDGWFKTGDIGEVDGDGFLKITDRKKEILKTSGGKMIAPAPIEGKLKANTLVSQAALVGDKHKFACVLISPNLQALEGWAKANGVAAKGTAELVKDKKVVGEYQRIVDEVNKTLGHHETLKRMTVVGEEWSIEGGELTPSMKLKRRVVEKKYEKEIAEFYRDEDTAKA